jgi:hypothetical protein
MKISGNNPLFHKARRQIGLIGDVNVLTPHEVRRLVTLCCETFSPVCCLILASLSTGISPEYIIDKDTSFYISSKPELNSCGFIPIPWVFPDSHLSEFNEELFEPINSSGFILFPKEIAQGIVQLRQMTQSISSIHKQMDQIFAKASTNTGKRIKSNRVKSYVHHIYEKCGLDNADLCALSQPDFTKVHSSVDYTRQSQATFTNKQKQIWQFLLDSCTNVKLTFPSIESNRSFGSKRVPTALTIQSLFFGLKNQIIQQSKQPSQLTATFNAFTTYTFCLLDLCLLHRPEKTRYGTQNSLDLISGYAFIEDKMVGDLHHRELPIASAGILQLEQYIAYLKSLYEKCFFSHPALRPPLSDIINGNKEMFQFLRKSGKEFKDNSNRAISEGISEYAKISSNWARHYMRNFLRPKITAEYLNAFCGNEGLYLHSYGEFSTLTLQNLKSISVSIDQHIRYDLQIPIIQNPLANGVRHGKLQ